MTSVTWDTTSSPNVYWMNELYIVLTFCSSYFLTCIYLLSLLLLLFGCTKHHAGSLFPDQGWSTSPCIGSTSLNHWTAKEVPHFVLIIF